MGQLNGKEEDAAAAVASSGDTARIAAAEKEVGDSWTQSKEQKREQAAPYDIDVWCVDVGGGGTVLPIAFCMVVAASFLSVLTARAEHDNSYISPVLLWHAIAISRRPPPPPAPPPPQVRPAQGSHLQNRVRRPPARRCSCVGCNLPIPALLCCSANE
jgi:hypothetical protein